MQIDSSNSSINLLQSGAERLTAENKVNGINSELKAKGRKYTSKLGQDHFLKLLITQLKHQDPLSPMKDKDFIAQMAQFSSLEQMTKVNNSIQSLSLKAESSSNYQLIGKKITWIDSVTGRENAGVAKSLILKDGESYLSIGNAQVSRKEIVKVELN